MKFELKRRKRRPEAAVAVSVALLAMLTLRCMTVDATTAPPSQNAGEISAEIPSDVREARAIAITAFQRSTGGEIHNYSIDLVDEDVHAWVFWIKGEGEQARPGYHWIVSVCRADGSVEVTPGE